MNVVVRKLRCITRKVVRVIFGSDVLFRTPVLQRLLAFHVSGEIVRDFNLPVAMTYERHSVIGNLLFYNGEFEEPEIRFVSKFLRGTRAPVVLDIGANIGWHAIQWAADNRDVQIYAFEPSAKTAELLTRNVKLNGLEKRIRHVPCAVADHEGVAEFHECEDSGYSSMKDTKRKTIISRTSVPVITVDRFVEDEKMTHLALIKIDVEGLETEVLRGALGTLQTIAPEVVVEIYGGQASNPNPEETIRLMQSIGYKAFHWKNGEIVPYSFHSDKHFNYYFTKQ